MYRLPLPTAGFDESFTASVATIRAEANRLSFDQVATLVELGCERFNLLANAQRLSDARSAEFNVAGFGIDMTKLYEMQFSNNSQTKVLRDSLKNSAPNDRCPYCGEGLVTELDHYLPKASFPRITVHPPNLVPACRDCNYVKRAYQPDTEHPAVLHPYFDSALDIHWLEASIEEGSLGTPIIIFSIKSSGIDNTLKRRLEAHMRVFDLWRRYSIKATQALEGFERSLRIGLDVTLNLDEARSHLSMNARQQSGERPNSWEYAVYTAMAANDWYLIDYLGLRT